MARILVIDDDEQVRRLLVVLLERAGHAVATAPDGRAGIALAGREPFALVITDIVMPEEEGIGVINRLKSLAPEIKIIAISGGLAHYNYDYLQTASLMGADRTLAKPFMPDDVVRTVDELLDT